MEGPSVNLYVRALRTWWWLALAVPVLAVLAGVYLTSRQPRTYRASATVAVMPSPGIADPSDVMRALETLERRTIIATFASMAETKSALGLAVANLGLENSEVSGYRIRASVLPSTNIIRIDVQGRDSQRVSDLANELAGVMATQAREMYRIFEMRALEAARPPRGPFHPDPARNAVIAGVLGLFAGLLLTLLMESVRLPRSGRVPASSGESEAGGAAREPLASWPDVPSSGDSRIVSSSALGG